jgi:hypothetical protein
LWWWWSIRRVLDVAHAFQVHQVVIALDPNLYVRITRKYFGCVGDAGAFFLKLLLVSLTSSPA